MGTIWRLRRSLLIAACGAGVAACPAIDPERPIALVLEGAWAPHERTAVALAAESWNVEFGLQLAVATDEGTAAAQRVPVSFSEFVCAHAGGVTVYYTMEVQLCRLATANLFSLFHVMRHELGHVVGIRPHTDDERAVMNGTMVDISPFFRAEDHRLFDEANPDFVGRGGCHVARRIATSPNRPLVVGHAGVAYVLWAEPGALRFSALDPATAEATGPAGRVATTGLPSFIRPLPSAEGFWLLWVDGDDGRMRATQVRLPGGEVDPVVTLEVNGLEQADELAGISVTVGGGEVLVTTSRQPDPTDLNPYEGTVWFDRVDLASGSALPFAFPALDTLHGQLLVEPASGALLAGHVDRSDKPRLLPVVERLDPGGSVLERLELPEVYNDSHGTLRLFAAAGRPLLVVGHDRRLMLYQLRLGGGLAVVAERELVLPGSWWDYRHVALLEHRGRLVLATSVRQHLSLAGGAIGYALDDEVWVTTIGADTLATLQPWRRLSGDALSYSLLPSLAPAGDGVVAVWKEAHVPRDHSLVRARCLELR